MRRALLLVCGIVLALPAGAEPPGDALSWLQRMAQAAQRLNYTGTFTYQSGATTETSRITHLVDANGEQEKLEVLDGSPREVVRSNDEVRCFLPEERIVIVEQRRQHKSFPALLPPAVEAIADSYQVRKGGLARVAGLPSQLVILEPKDALRYGHHLWAEVDTGLILKARTLNERNETVEQFFFNQIQINGTIDRAALRSRFETEGKDWRVHNVQAAQSLSAGGDWLFRASLPGFRKSAGMKRLGPGGTETTHFVFSDGLASISVFIEPLQGRLGEQATYSVGAINVYKRVTGTYQLTVLGEVPMATLRRLGDGMEPKRK